MKSAAGGALKTTVDFWGNAARDAINDISGTPLASTALGADPPPSQQPSPAPQTSPAAAQPSAPVAPQPAAPTPEPEVRIPSGPNTQTQLNKGIEEEKLAEQAKADALTAQSMETQKILDSGIVARQQILDNNEKEYQANEQQRKKLAQDISNTGIDPNRYWTSKSAGSKAGSIIGMILGGIGSGITGGPNLAVQLLQKQAEADVHAQEVNLGKQQTSLGHFIQQGHDIRQARQLAVAENLEKMKGQIMAAANKQSSPIAQAAAKAAIGSLDVQASQNAQQAYAARTENQLKQLQIMAEKRNMVIQGETLKTMQRLTSGDGIDPRVLELPAFKDYRERAVTLPDGTKAFDASPERAKATQTQLDSIDSLRKPLQRYNGLYNNGHPTVSPSDKGAAEAIRSEIVAGLGNLRDAGSLRGAEYEQRLAEVPDIRDLWTPKAAGKISELGKFVDDKHDIATRGLSGIRKKPTADLVRTR